MAKQGLRMKALMTLPASGTRKEVARNGEFNAHDDQEAKDLWQRGRAEFVTTETPAKAK